MGARRSIDLFDTDIPATVMQVGLHTSAVSWSFAVSLRIIFDTSIDAILNYCVEEPRNSTIIAYSGSECVCKYFLLARKAIMWYDM